MPFSVLLEFGARALSRCARCFGWSSGSCVGARWAAVAVAVDTLWRRRARPAFMVGFAQDPLLWRCECCPCSGAGHTLTFAHTRTHTHTRTLAGQQRRSGGSAALRADHRPSWTRWAAAGDLFRAATVTDLRLRAAVLVFYRSHRHPRGWRPVSCQRRFARRRTHGFGRAAHRANVRAIGVGPHASSRRRSRAVAAVIIGRGEAAPLLPSLCTTSHAYLNVKYRAHLRRRPDATERAPPLPRQRPQRGGRSWWTRAARALHGL